MKKHYIHLLLIVSFLLTNYQLIAQKDTSQKSENILQYIEDKVFESKNILKFNLASVVAGDLSVSYERIISNSFGIEGGAGILLPFYTPNLNELIGSKTQIINNPKGGFSFIFQPKLYLNEEAPENAFIGLKLRVRNYKQDTLLVLLTYF